MDIHKSIMQIRGDIPRQPMRYASNNTSATGESRNENTDVGDAPTLSTLNLFYEKL